jgi:hypothetical protein
MTGRFYPNFFLFFLVVLFADRPAFGQEAKQAHSIRLKSGVISPSANAHAWLDSISNARTTGEPVLVLMHFNSLPTKEQRVMLQQSGIMLQDYIPDNTFYALVQQPVNAANIRSLPVHSITGIQPEWKADNYLWKKVNSNKGAVEVLISFYSNIDGQAARQFVSAIGGQIDAGPMEKYGSYKVIIPANKVRSIAQWYGVRYISPVSDIVPLDLASRPVVKGNIAIAPPIYGGYGLTGDSVTVGVGDNSSGIHHADLEDRITNFNPAPLSHHGAHVNGIVGSAANVDPFAATTTPHVSLIDHLYDLILPATGAMYRDYNMTIGNNSYSVIAADCDYSGTYDVYSQLVDTLSIQYPEVQHVFASGNDGWMSCSPYPTGFATVAGGYQPAKNDIVVGSIINALEQANDESRGPVKDGRLKPEVVAIGLIAYSTVPGDQYIYAAGTSMASPQVAGGLAAITQHYKHLNGGTQPRADMLKALLLNGAMDLGNPGPDYSYGFGSMDLYRSLKMIDAHNYTNGTIANGDSQSLTIIVPPNTGQLKVMLYWNDVPASASAARQLVNDLDLTVKDPSAGTHLPLVLDPTAANVNNNAIEKADHTNNVEQVTITNPAGGTYTIKTKGYSIPYGPQPYVVVYDIMPKGIHLTYPIGGEQLANTNDPFDSLRVFWDAVSDGNPFTVQFSTDNGASWVTVSDNVSPDLRRCDFVAGNVNSGNCRVRVMRNNTFEIAASDRFSISTKPTVALDTVQCPGYINIHWSPVPNATGYYLLKKTGFYMQVVDSTTDTAYSFSGMPLNKKSYVAVQPIIDDRPAYRSVAVIAIANTGNCSKSISRGDLAIEKILSPQSGRLFTSSAAGPSTPLTIQVRDLYAAPCNNVVISYRVNGGIWHAVPLPVAIPANGSAAVSLPGFYFPAPGSYTISVAVHNLDLPDPQPANDTSSITVLTIPNDTINLATPFFDGFETMARESVTHDSIGVSPNGHWDFYNTNDSGRMRSFVYDDVTISGSRSISMDVTENLRVGSNNTFVGTFNLSRYDTAASEVRVDFDYVLHGTPRSTAGNIVSARGNDAAAWNKIFTYDLGAFPGTLSHAKSLSLTDALRSTNTNFSPSTQISFGQNDTSLIAGMNYGNGLTLDNFKIYTVTNDAQIVGVVSPLPVNCGLASPASLTIQVRNGVNYTLYNVHVYFRMDSATTYSGIIDSIAAKSTVNYTFMQPINVVTNTTHSLDVWLNEAGDTYKGNDSLLNYHFRNSATIAFYPYLENFEASDGGYFSDGFRNSWQYGTPATVKVNRAASGVKAWKTNLTGHYNNLEKSYLYSPCFDISRLINPMLSFSTAQDVENCGGALCDAAWIEYSYDGATWRKLGAPGQGTNWYDSTFDVWNTEGFTRWHVASVPIPQLGGGQTLHFRFVLSADPGVTFEGLAVDDIHIFERNNTIFPETGATTVSQEISGGQWADFLENNQLLAAVQPNGQSIPGTAVTLYAHDTLYNSGATQYTFPRSYTIQAAKSPADSTGVRLFLLESDMVKVLKDTTCLSCSPIKDAYSLGVTQYSSPGNSYSENGTLADDTGGVFTFYPYKSVTWVPYDNGYYAELKVKPFSEFWFNDGGPTGNLPAATDYLAFVAFKTGQNVTAAWYSLIDTAVNSYVLERSEDSVHFDTVTIKPSVHATPGQYSLVDSVNFSSSTVLYYRLKWTMHGSSQVYYSPIRKVDYSDSANGLIAFDARMTDHKHVAATWTSYIDGVVNQYLLERSIGNSAYTTIDNVPAAHYFGRQYSYIDQPTGNIPDNTPIHYRLTATLGSGNNIVLPVRTITWNNNNSVDNIFPNPTHDGNFTIQWFADSGTAMNISVFDAAGRAVYETAASASHWSNTTTVHMPAKAKGFYIVRLDIGGRRSTVKLVYE